MRISTAHLVINQNELSSLLSDFLFHVVLRRKGVTALVNYDYSDLKIRDSSHPSLFKRDERFLKTITSPTSQLLLPIQCCRREQSQWWCKQGWSVK